MWLYRWCWGFCCQRMGKNKWPTRNIFLWSTSGEDHVGVNILSCLNNISIVMLIWKWPFFQTILDRYSLNEIFKPKDKSHILDIDEKEAIGVKKKQYTFHKKKQKACYFEGSISKIENVKELVRNVNATSYYLMNVVNIFFMKRPCYWNKSFGICPLKSKECMVWIFWKGCIKEEAWNGKNISQYMR